MSKVGGIIALHPLGKAPYRSIRFAGISPHGGALYHVDDDSRRLGPRKALKEAVKRHGADCFHCGKRLRPQDLSPRCDLDHLRPKKDGGGNQLHNLVVTCGKCNRRKGERGLVAFHRGRAAEYLDALEAHLSRCLAELAKG